MQIKRIGDGKDFRRSSGFAGRSRYFRGRGRISFAGIAGPQCLRLLRQGLVGFLATDCRAMPPPPRNSSIRACARRGVRSETSPTISWCRARAGRLGAVSISIIRRQFDKTYVAVAFDNHGRAVTLNFILVNGPRRLADFRRREPARFAADVPRPVSGTELIRSPIGAASRIGRAIGPGEAGGRRPSSRQLRDPVAKGRARRRPVIRSSAARPSSAPPAPRSWAAAAAGGGGGLNCDPPTRLFGICA